MIWDDMKLQILFAIILIPVSLLAQSESQHVDAAIERLRFNSYSSVRNYETSISTRLVDALKKTSKFNTRKPEVYVRIFIAADGVLSWQKIERSSGDRMFELAVLQAVEMVNKNPIPTPNGKAMVRYYLFKPLK
jgi:TonB family protein